MTFDKHREEEGKRHILKLCLSPEAEWTITFKNPYSPVDSSSVSGEKVEKTVQNMSRI